MTKRQRGCGSTRQLATTNGPTTTRVRVVYNSVSPPELGSKAYEDY